jgi:hypothetical protein
MMRCKLSLVKIRAMEHLHGGNYSDVVLNVSAISDAFPYEHFQSGVGCVKHMRVGVGSGKTYYIPLADWNELLRYTGTQVASIRHV